MELSEELYYLVQALATAVNMRFMSADHAALLWKLVLKHKGFDYPKINKKKEDEIKNGETKEN